ncbi:MAG: GNAT family N-acetyltransferase [candidate division WOR-3 bacterium]|nr:MAG: GNAT family N-acetyltransferase [candidate division WOR-3 bacterium]
MHRFAEGKYVILRPYKKSDLDAYMRWMAGGEWQKYDTPWESGFTSQKEARQRFKEMLEDKPVVPNRRAVIATKKDLPIGWVNRYAYKRFPANWLIGICIGEDEFLNKGFGSEAFGLWVDYLFINSDIHRLGFATYSFNPRMIQVGKKLGFTHEGTDREIIFWKNKWLDRLHFGILRKEWEKRQSIGVRE